MSVHETSFTEFLARLQRCVHKRDVTFLVGAGISMLPPSCLPSGFALIDAAVSGICTIRQLANYYRRIKMHPRYHTIAPEILFQRFYACLDEPTFTSFFDVLRDATPNPMHSVLATLSLSHRLPILTTNFDRLIERASRPSTPIVHLHGDLEKPMTMVTRIH